MNDYYQDHCVPSSSREKGGKKAWTPEEDQQIISLVARLGCKHWSKLAKIMNDECTTGTIRSGKQCRERWHNHLDSSIKKGPWTKEEEALLIAAHAEHGNQWSKIAKLFVGRTDNAIKNRWFAKQRREMRRNGKTNSKCDSSISDQEEEQMTPRQEYHDRVRALSGTNYYGGISPKPDAMHSHSTSYSHLHNQGSMWSNGGSSLPNSSWRSLHHQMDDLNSLEFPGVADEDNIDINQFSFGLRNLETSEDFKRDRHDPPLSRTGYPLMEIDLDWTDKVLI